MADAFAPELDQTVSDPYASTIQTIEGWYPGSKSYRNNNPGNLKFADQPGATGADPQGFAIFPDYKTGFNALHRQVGLDAKRGLSIQEFTDKYAPAQDGNDPKSYAAVLAAAVGKRPTDPVGLGAFDDSADAFGAGSDRKPTTSTSSPSVWDTIKGFGSEMGSDLKKQAEYVKGLLGNIPGDIAQNIHNPFAKVTPEQQAAEAGMTNPVTGDQNLWEAGKGFLNDPAGTIQKSPVTSAVNIAGLLGLAKGGGEEEAPVRPTSIPGSDAFTRMHETAVKPAIEALNPTDPNAFTESMTRTIPLLKDENPDIGKIISKNPSDAKPIVSSALQKLHEKMSEFVAPAELAGERIDGNIIADEKMAAIPPKLKDTDPAAYQQMKNEADTYRRPLKPSEVQSYLETTNDQAAGLYDKLPGERNISVGASAAKGQLITEGNAFRQQLYQSLDPEHGGALVRALQLRRGSLIDFDHNLDEMVAAGKQAPTPSMWQKVGSAYDTGKALLPTTEGRGGPALDRAAAALKQPQVAQQKVGSAFDNWKGQSLPAIQTPPLLSRQWGNTAPFPKAPPEGWKPEYPGQPPPDQYPPPRQGVYPSTPGMPERPQFNIQRELFGPNTPGIRGNTRVPPPKYPGQPPSSTMTGGPQLPPGRDWEDAEVVQGRLTSGRPQLPPGQRQLPPPDSNTPTARPNPPVSFKQGGGPYRIVTPGGVELGSYEDLASAQKAVHNATGGYRTGQYQIHYKNQKRLQ
jgi:hypothetical protein